MNKIIPLALLAAIALGGCSGRTDDTAEVISGNGPGSGNSPTIGAAQSEAGIVRILTASPTLKTGASETAAITALVTDDSNRVVAGQDVLFSSDRGVLQSIVSTTNDAGEATAQLNLAGDYRNQNITVTATVGDVFAEVLVTAAGTALEIEAPSDLVVGQTAMIDLRLLSGDGQPVPNQVISLNSAAGNRFSEASVTTDSTGAASVSLSTVEGSDTLTATAVDGTVVQTATLNVVQSVEDVQTPVRIRVISDKSSVETGGNDIAAITALITDDSNRVVEGQEVVFSSDGGVLQNIMATTTQAGEATALLNLAGDYRNRNITVTATVGDYSADVLVAATGTILEMTAPADLVIGQTADIEFTLLAGDGQPIPNQLIALSSEAGNTFSQNSVTTGALGTVGVSVSTVEGPDTLTASAFDSSVVQAFSLGVVDTIQDVKTPIRIRVISNESSIETGGNDIARITTLVTDESNRVIGGKEVQFSSSGGVLQNISSITNEAGQATAELSLAGDYRNQDITVAAEVDDEVGSVLIATSGSSLSIAGPTALVSGNNAELEFTLTGGNDQPIANEQISITSEAGNTVSLGSTKTDASGKALVVVGSEVGDDVITVSALENTVVATHAINVAEDILTVLAPDDYEALDVDTFWSFKVKWESSGQPVFGASSVPGEPIKLKFSITAGVVRAEGDTGAGSSSVEVATDANGVATIEIKSSSAGPATVAFADAQDSDPFSQFDVEFVASDIALISIDATPASVATGNPSTISAVVTDDFGNPVKDVVVEFSSPDLKGGTLSPVTALTDSNGRARVTFTAGSLSTETDEIDIVATASDEPSVSELVKMTVTKRQLNVIIGLAGDLTEADTDTRYRKAGIVQVTDGAGRPVPDATILVSVIPTIYRFGRLITIDTNSDGEDDAWVRAPEFPVIDPDKPGLHSYSCLSEDKNGNRVLENSIEEDLNRNGTLDPGEDTNGNGRLDVNEDVNNNGELDPRDPALVDEDPVNQPTVIGGQITTDSNGVGFFSLAYPQSNAWWFDVLINARVQALGTEAVAQYEITLDVLASDVDDVDKAPPNLFSPYGEVNPSNLPVCERPF